MKRKKAAACFTNSRDKQSPRNSPGRSNLPVHRHQDGAGARQQEEESSPFCLQETAGSFSCCSKSLGDSFSCRHWQRKAEC